MSAVIALLTGLGVGSGGLYILYMTAVRGASQTEAQGLNLLFFVAACISASLVNVLKGRVSASLVFPLAVSGCIFAVLTSLAASHLDSTLLSRAFGAFLVTAGIFGLFSKRK